LLAFAELNNLCHKPPQHWSSAFCRLSETSLLLPAPFRYNPIANVWWTILECFGPSFFTWQCEAVFASRQPHIEAHIDYMETPGGLSLAEEERPFEPGGNSKGGED
jgi:hypothetical protein